MANKTKSFAFTGYDFGIVFCFVLFFENHKQFFIVMPSLRNKDALRWSMNEGNVGQPVKTFPGVWNMTRIVFSFFAKYVLLRFA